MDRTYLEGRDGIARNARSAGSVVAFSQPQWNGFAP